MEISLKPLDTGRDLIPLALEGFDLKNIFRPGMWDMERGKGGAVDL